MHHALRGHENPALDAAATVAAQLALPLLVLHTIPEATPYASDRLHLFQLQGARDVARELGVMGVRYELLLPQSERHWQKAGAMTPGPAGQAGPGQPAPAQATPSQPRAAEAAADEIGKGGSALLAVCKGAALVVTEEMPVRPWSQWIAALAKSLAPLGVPMWAVDTACVVPMRLVGRAFDRAFAFRDKTMPLRQARLALPWPARSCQVPAPYAGDLPFEPVPVIDASDADLAHLLAGCDIDHTIGPVPHTPGGALAGYARWEAFKADGKLGLNRYDEVRNDALLDGVSRMSPYLHYGMVSPMRIAREALAFGGSGAAKYLDELLTWRELAYDWCFFRPDHDTLTSIPDWARATLAQHQTDARPALYSHAQLARAQTDDELWNAAQRSLLIHGELHNNVRMTWGKALLAWTPNAQRCLELLIDLNHRYALDGRDPASFGGILWCLGLFDRPFTPEQRILGTVRSRPTREHAGRLNVAAYAKKTSRPLLSLADGRAPRVVVIGAGLAGALCARTLADHRLAVTLLDKGRGPGGRTSTRRAEPYQWDHGAQYFTARSPLVQRLAASWLEEGIIAPWRARLATASQNGISEVDARTASVERYVGVPGMNAVVGHLVDGAKQAGAMASYNTEVASVIRAGDAWAVLDGSGREISQADVVILATPPENLRKIWPNASAASAEPGDKLIASIGTAQMAPTWALMLVWDRPLAGAAGQFDGVFIDGGPGSDVLAWVARDNSKPGRRRDAEDVWVLHASHAWSQANVERSEAEVTEAMLGAFAAMLRCGPLPAPAVCKAHRWRYASVRTTLADRCVWDGQNWLGACGDWCGPGKSKVEQAILSGAAMAGRVMNALALVTPAPVGRGGGGQGVVGSAGVRGQRPDPAQGGLFDGGVP